METKRLTLSGFTEEDTTTHRQLPYPYPLSEQCGDTRSTENEAGWGSYFFNHLYLLSLIFIYLYIGFLSLNPESPCGSSLLKS